jgi:peptidoglycan-N-acetylglucosamine deacetylase
MWLLLPGTIFLMLLIYGSANMQSNFFTTAFCYAIGAEKQIALSFDDGPNHEFTPQVLSTLAQYNASATFFIIGKNIQGNENILKQIDVAGHSIGNHSHTHSFFIDFKSVQGLKDELTQTTESVFKVIGKRMTLFRPPYGVITPNLAKVINILDYRVIGWSIRSFDTTAGSAQSITQRVQSQIKPGAIILFHDTSDKTIQALKQTLDFAKNNDYKVVSIEQLLKIKAYE